MPRTKSRPTVPPSRFTVEQLEDRSVPTVFTSATFNFEQDSTPSLLAALPSGPYSGAIVTGTPTTATGTIGGFPNSTAGFTANLALGSLVDATAPPKALQLDATTTRSGVNLSWGTQGIANIAGDDLLIYETEPGAPAAALPEAFMIQVHDATTNTWSTWYYEPADTKAAITIGGSAATVFATSIDLSNLGLASGDIIDAVRIVNMTAADRMVNASGIGAVTPEAGAGTGFAPSAGTLGLAATFSPEILYVGSDNVLTNPLVDLTVTKTDNATQVGAGQQVTYTIVVSNTGLTTATGTAFADTLPASLSGVTWTSTTSTGVTGSAASGTGNIAETLSLPVGASITYTVTGTLSATATGTLSNTATATPSTAFTDADTSDNSATDTTTILPQVDVQVTKTDGLNNVSPGQQITYTIVVSNSGPNAATGTAFADALSASLTGVSWTSTATGGATGNSATGTGSINQTLDLPTNSSVTYRVTGTVAAAASGTISNTASATVATSLFDANTANNSATDLDAVGTLVNLSVTKTDGQKFAVNGLPTTYTITVSNLGNTPAFGARVQDLLPAGFSSATWTSSSTGGAMGSVGSGSGSINELIDLPAGATVTYTLRAVVSNAARGGLTNTVSVTPTSGITDTNPADNTARDRDTVLPKAVPAYYRQFAAGADEGASGHVKVYNPDGSVRLSFIAFENFNGGVRVATGDVNGDGINDIVVGAGFGAGNGHIKVFDGATGALIASFFSFENFLGGVDVAVGDVNGDGFGDIIVGSGVGAAHVKVFSLATGSPIEIASFIAFAGYTGGLSVSAGDINGDGLDDIIVGAAAGPAHVKVFSMATGAPVEIVSLIVTGSYTGGIDVAAGDLFDSIPSDGIFRDEIVVSPTGASGQVYVLDFGSAVFSATPAITSFTPNFPGRDSGMRVAVSDVEGDGDDDIVLAGGPGRSAKVRAFDASFAPIRDLTAFEGFQGGVFVG